MDVVELLFLKSGNGHT